MATATPARRASIPPHARASAVDPKTGPSLTTSVDEHGAVPSPKRPAGPHARTPVKSAMPAQAPAPVRAAAPVRTVLGPESVTRQPQPVLNQPMPAQAAAAVRTAPEPQPTIGQPQPTSASLEPTPVPTPKTERMPSPVTKTESVPSPAAMEAPPKAKSTHRFGRGEYLAMLFAMDDTVQGRELIRAFTDHLLAGLEPSQKKNGDGEAIIPESDIRISMEIRK